MLRTVLVLVATAGVVLLGAWLLSDPTGGRPVEVTTRHLIADPSLYDGHEVCIRTRGFEAATDPRVLVYRPRATAPPEVILRFADPVPDPAPLRVRGRLRAGRPAEVTGCRPH